MRYEIEPTAYAIRVYEDSSDQYVAVAQARIYGDRCWISSISSPKFFTVGTELLFKAMDELGVLTLEGYMSRVMSRALRMSLKSLVTISHKGTCAGREMDWIIVTKPKLS
jgi:hypothetical protein